MRLRSWLAGVVCLASTWPVLAAAGEVYPLARFEHTAFTHRDGAPSEVDGIAQTTDGMLWLASDRGLFSFDGVRFNQFVPAKGEALLESSTNRLFARPDGSLVIDYVTDRVSVLKDGHLTHVTALPGVAHVNTTMYAQGQDADIWIADTRGIAILQGTRSRIVATFPSGPGLDGIAVDRDNGNAWIARGGRLLLLRHGGGAPIDVAAAPPDVFAMTWLRPGWLAVSTRAKTLLRYRIEGEHLVPLEPLNGFSDDAMEDRRGGVWLTDLGAGVHYLAAADASAAAVETMGSDRGLSGDYTYRSYEDREGNVWISTQAGVDRFRALPFAPLPTPRGAHSLTVMPGQGADVWLGSENNPLLRWDGTRLVPTDVPPFAMSYGWDGSAAWTAPKGGLWRLDRGGVERVSTMPPGFFPIALARDGEGHTWFVTLKGASSVTVLRNGVLEPWDAGFKARSITRAPDGALWIGGEGNRLVRVEGGGRRDYASDHGLAVGTVRAMAWHAGETWVAGLSGVQVLRGGHFQTLSVPGAMLTDVTGLAFDAEGNLWVHGMNGLVRVAAYLLPRLGRDAAPGDVRQFDQPDGVQGLPSDIRSLPSLRQGEDGRLWVQNLSYAASIDPRNLPPPVLPPSPRILSVRSSGRDVLVAGHARLDARMRDLQVAYTAPVLGVPERARFRYRLDGFDKVWQDASMRRAAYYTNLPPGHYTFHVQAGNEAGAWNATEAVFTLSVAPAWYQATWFFCLVAVLAIVLVFALHRWHLRRLAAQWRIRLDERTAVARDLHDTILQGAQGTAIQLQALARDVTDGDLRDRLSRIADLARGTAAESRARLEDLRAHGEDDRFPIGALVALGEQLSRQHGVVFVHDVRGSIIEMAGGAGREVRSAVGEMLINAFTHAKASRIELCIDFGRRFVATVRDDGTGVDTNQVEAARKAGHFGLRGLEERAGRLGGQVEWVGAAAGTCVALSVAGSRLYAR